MQSVFSFIVRLVLLLAGLLVAASIALAVFLLLVFWGLRMLWAKLTGRPVVPFVSGLTRAQALARFFEPDKLSVLQPRRSQIPAGATRWPT